MSLKKVYKEETGKDWLIDGDGLIVIPSEDYIDWLEQRLEAGQHEPCVIGEIKDSAQSMLIEAKHHAEMGKYDKAHSLYEQSIGIKFAIDIIRKNKTQ